MGCKSCEIACAVAHSQSRSLPGAIFEQTPPRKRIYVQAVEQRSVPVSCRHCEEAACAKVCPTGAMQKSAATGVVSQDVARCIGCGFCEMSCPFGVINRLPESKIVAKCDLCLGLEAPACVMACPTRAILFITAQEVQQKKRQLTAELFAAGDASVMMP
jgi:carbon-monoxide dehydrogenase iron sulfur subunit